MSDSSYRAGYTAELLSLTKQAATSTGGSWKMPRFIDPKYLKSVLSMFDLKNQLGFDTGISVGESPKATSTPVPQAPPVKKIASAPINRVAQAFYKSAKALVPGQRSVVTGQQLKPKVPSGPVFSYLEAPTLTDAQKKWMQFVDSQDELPQAVSERERQRRLDATYKRYMDFDEAARDEIRRIPMFEYEMNPQDGKMTPNYAKPKPKGYSNNGEERVSEYAMAAERAIREMDRRKDYEAASERVSPAPATPAPAQAQPAPATPATAQPAPAPAPAQSAPATPAHAQSAPATPAPAQPAPATPAATTEAAPQAPAPEQAAPQAPAATPEAAPQAPAQSAPATPAPAQPATPYAPQFDTTNEQTAIQSAWDRYKWFNNHKLDESAEAVKARSEPTYTRGESAEEFYNNNSSMYGDDRDAAYADYYGKKGIKWMPADVDFAVHGKARNPAAGTAASAPFVTGRQVGGSVAKNAGGRNFRSGGSGLFAGEEEKDGRGDYHRRGRGLGTLEMDVNAP